MTKFTQTWQKLILFFGGFLFISAISPSEKTQKFLKKNVKENPILTPYIKKSISYLQIRRFDSALIITQQGLPLALKLKDSVAIGKMYYNLTLYHRYVGHFPEAKKYIKKGIEILTSVGHSKYLANSMYLLNVVIADEGNVEGAIAEGLTNLKFFESIGETDDLTRTYGLLNSLFSDHKDPFREKQFRDEFLNKIKRSKDHIFKAQGFSIIALDYEARADYNGAWPYWLESLKAQRFDKFSPNHVLFLISMSKNLRQRGLYQKAIPYLEEARLAAESRHNNILLSAVYREFSFIELNLHNDKLALILARKAMDLLRYNPHKNEILPALQDLAVVEEQTGHYKEALRVNKEISVKKDSLFNNERSKIIAAASAKYDLEKKENKISSQNKELRLQRAVAESVRIKLQASNQKMYLLLAVVLLLFLLALIIGFSYYKAKQLQKQLADSNLLKDKIFSIVSHDLRSPIGSLKASLSLLQSKKLSQENFDRFEQQVDFLQYTMDNVLYWSLSQQNAVRVIPMLIDPMDIISEVADSLQGLIRIKNINLIIKGSSDEIKIDEQLLIIVLRNILHNAIKFTPAKGNVTIETLSNHVGTYIYIRDNGPGLQTKEDVSTVVRKEGTGLGLNLSRELMKRNKGDLKIHCLANVGTTVTLFWKAINSD